MTFVDCRVGTVFCAHAAEGFEWIVSLRFGVAIATGCFNAGFRTGERDTFFCSAKRKYPKKRRPRCRDDPARRDFRQGFFDGASQPLRKTCGIPAAPLRAIPDKSPGARHGKRGVNPVKLEKN